MPTEWKVRVPIGRLPQKGFVKQENDLKYLRNEA